MAQIKISDLYPSEGENVTLGVVNADGNFQKFSFDGTTPSSSGTPETVNQYATWNSTLNSPRLVNVGDTTATSGNVETGKVFYINTGARAEGALDTAYYKCASVDTTTKTWTGYKAVLYNGAYVYDINLTTGLTYTSRTPEVGKCYTADALVIANLWRGVEKDLLFYMPLAEARTTAETGQQVTATSVTYETYYNIPCVYFGTSNSTISCTDQVSDICSKIEDEQEFTLSLWIRPYYSYRDQSMCLLYLGDTSNFIGLYTGVVSGRYGLCGVFCKDGTVEYGSYEYSTMPYRSWWWRHCLCTYQDGILKVYGEGNLGATVSVGKNISFVGKTLELAPLTFTSILYYYYHFQDHMACVRIYNRALTQDEITTLASEFTPSN